MLLSLPTRGDLDTDTAPDIAHVLGRQRRVESIEQILRDPLLLPQQRAPRGLAGVSRKHRFDAQALEQLEYFRQRQTTRFERGQRVLDPARLRPLAVSDEVLPAASDAVDLLREVHRLKPCGECAYQVPGEGRRTASKARRQLGCGLRVAVAATDGSHAVLFNHLEQSIAALLPENLTDKRPEGVHVIAQRLVLGWEMYVAAAHEAANYIDKGAIPLTPRAARTRRAPAPPAARRSRRCRHPAARSHLKARAPESPGGGYP